MGLDDACKGPVATGVGARCNGCWGPLPRVLYRTYLNSKPSELNQWIASRYSIVFEKSPSTYRALLQASLWIYRALGVEKGAVERAQGEKNTWALHKGGKSPWALHTADHYCSALIAVAIAITYIYIDIYSLVTHILCLIYIHHSTLIVYCIF